MKFPSEFCDLDLAHRSSSSINVDYKEQISNLIRVACLKSATTILLLKRLGLENKDVKYYQPIPNFPFISKLVEKVLARHIEENLNHNDLHDSFQSIY